MAPVSCRSQSQAQGIQYSRPSETMTPTWHEGRMAEIQCMAPLATSKRPEPSAARNRMPSAVPVARVHARRQVA